MNDENVTRKCLGSATPAEIGINQVVDLKRESTACLLKRWEEIDIKYRLKITRRLA